MKTTVEIPNALFEAAKRVAVKRGITLKEVIQTSLRNFLASQQTGSKPFKLRWHTFGGKGLLPEVAAGGWPEIRRRAYEGHGG